MGQGMTSVRGRPFVWAIAALLAASIAHAGDDAASEWVMRMNRALATRNYMGVLIHKTGPQREVLRIVHRTLDGRMNERVSVVSPVGQGREFVRNGSEWIAYYPEPRVALVQTRNRSYGFLTALNGFNDDTRRFYNVTDGGSVALDAWAAHRIVLEPRDDQRYGYRFWLDEKTGLPLKTQIVTRAGEVIDEVAFLNLALPERINDDELKPEADTAGYHWMRRDQPMYTPGLKKAYAPRADLLPAGFRVRIFTSAAEEARAVGPRTRFIVSDGIAWVSVWIEKAEQNPGLGDVMGPKDKARAMHGMRPDGVVVMGASATYMAKLEDGLKVTVVGEVPPATVKAIAEAVRSE
jgi:sigma-E factor negative regulatory protein RseB